MLALAQNWKVVYIPRNANRATHGLAKLACSLPNDLIWMGECPKVMMDVILEDKLCIGLFDE